MKWLSLGVASVVIVVACSSSHFAGNGDKKGTGGSSGSGTGGASGVGGSRAGGSNGGSAGAVDPPEGGAAGDSGSGGTTGGSGGSSGTGGSSGSSGDAGTGGEAGTPGACGDSRVDEGEGCDDGNPTPGDGCNRCRRIEEVSTSGNHACIRIDDGTVKCWGGNYEGQLGLGDQNNRGDVAGEVGPNLRLVDLGTERRTKLVLARSFRTCAIMENDAVKCWGQNTSGQLGTGDNNSRGDMFGEMGDELPEFNLGTGRRATALAMGEVHTCALLTNHTVKCWGINLFGVTGRPEDDATFPTGDALIPVDLGTGRTATMITAGIGHTCALLDNGSIKCWGHNDMGQLGLGDIDSRGDTAGEMGDALRTVDLGTGRTAVSVVAGASHTCAILDNDAVKCWGANDRGQLGLGDLENRGDGLDTVGESEMGDHLPEVELGIGYTPVALAAGSGHTCALFDNGAVKCWGVGGANGSGTGETLGGMPGQMGDDLPVVSLGTGRSVRQLSAGAYGVCVLLDTYAIKCWGDNSFGQLGLGDQEPRGDARVEMGDNLPTLLLP